MWPKDGVAPTLDGKLFHKRLLKTTVAHEIPFPSVGFTILGGPEDGCTDFIVRLGFVARLLDLLRVSIRLDHYALRTGRGYVDWNRRFIRHVGKRRPRALGMVEVAQC